MVRITLFLLLLILRNNAYAWSCNFQNTEDGWYLQGSMVCNGIDPQEALQQHYCTWYRPNDPYCSIYQAPSCQDQVEYRTLSCSIHYSGAINQSRSFSCATNAWSDWYTTSDNCVQDPPTCIESTETRQLTCSSGFEGLLQEQRTSICSNPYGSPTWTTWSELLNTCKMTATNVNNVASPVSPISPLNPNSVINQVTTAPIIQPEPVIVQDMTALTTTTETPTTSVATVQSTSQTASTTTSNSTGSSVSKNTTTTSGTDKKEDIKAVVVPKGKDLVPGFGIVLSMQLLNSGYNMQQQQIEESIKLIQEQDYERQQNIFIDFIVSNDSRDYLIRASANRWRSILRDNPIQRFDRDD
jgi:hypothetical protein